MLYPHPSSVQLHQSPEGEPTRLASPEVPPAAFAGTKASAERKEASAETCGHCGKPLVGLRADAKYHRPCRQAAYMVRKRAQGGR
jgi:hypothetical protein